MVMMMAMMARGRHAKMLSGEGWAGQQKTEAAISS
jgi:hypothetical protein